MYSFSQPAAADVGNAVLLTPASDGTPKQVSIIMPVYNCAAFLPLALESVLAEKDLSFELIAVNDGSQDNSLDLLREAAERDGRIVVLDQPNQGQSAAINAALAVARGEWVTFVDADDWIAPGTYRDWHRQACADNLDVLVGNGYRFVDDPHVPERAPWFEHQPWGRVMSGSDWIVHCANCGEWPHNMVLQFIRRSLIEQHGLRFVPGLLHQNILWTMHLALASRRIGFAGQPVYGYRRNPDSIVNTYSESTVARRAHSYIYILKALVDTAAKSRGNPALRRALLRHANGECSPFHSVLCKRLQSAQLRREAARSFHDKKMWLDLLRGANGMREYRRVARCYLAVARYR
ncbi:MAG TPA: glycosyltransferase [Bordetella sp.]|jgi:glycosyltransferase involved in cell wall biosynthesis|nr:glycosyltransferase [Bordetella sp.]